MFHNGFRLTKEATVRMPVKDLIRCCSRDLYSSVVSVLWDVCPQLYSFVLVEMTTVMNPDSLGEGRVCGVCFKRVFALKVVIQ